MKRFLAGLFAFSLASTTASTVVSCGDEIQTGAMPPTTDSDGLCFISSSLYQTGKTFSTLSILLSGSEPKRRPLAKDVNIVVKKTQASISKELQLKDDQIVVSAQNITITFSLDQAKIIESALPTEPYQTFIKGFGILNDNNSGIGAATGLDHSGE